MTCPYCELPHTGDRCPTMLGQHARLQEAWGRLLVEVRRPFESTITRVRDDAELRRLLWVGALVAVMLLTVLAGPRVLALAAMAVVAGCYLGLRRVGQ